MNPFSAHPNRQGVSYLEHLLFAMGIAVRLFYSVIAFTVHAIFPFIDIRRELDLQATTDFLQERNQWIGNKKPARYSPPALNEHGPGKYGTDILSSPR
jgi:hypothetical protein